MNKKKYMGLAVISAMMMLSVTAWAANEGPLTISADTLSYDGNTGRAEASGNVVITQQDKTMTGANGWYNTKTREAALEGGVSMIGNNMAMSAQSVHSVNDNQFSAEGDVHLQRDDRQIFGDSVEYNSDTEYGKVSGNAKLIAQGTTLTGNQVEGWLKEIRAVAQHLIIQKKMCLVRQIVQLIHKHQIKMMELYCLLDQPMLFRMVMY